MKVNGSFSASKLTSLGVPQGSVLGPLLFNLYFNDFFYLVKETEVCNYADDTTIFACGSDLGSILESLERDAALLCLWFENNYMKMNEEKSHLLVFGIKDDEATVNISGSLIEESDEEKLLGMTLDKKLIFKIHVNNICKPKAACTGTSVKIYENATIRINSDLFCNRRISVIVHLFGCFMIGN